jgi:hypothetical protein
VIAASRLYVAIAKLIVVVRRQAERIARQDGQIAAKAGWLSELIEANEILAGKLARLAANSPLGPAQRDP